MTNTIFDIDLPEEALALLQPGQMGVTWRVRVPTFTPDPDTGTTIRTDAVHDILGSPALEYDVRLVAANVVERDATYILIAALGLPFTPTGPDQGLRIRRLLNGVETGATFVCKRLKVHSTGDRTALHEMELGR